jgi:hypothetical protein
MKDREIFPLDWRDLDARRSRGQRLRREKRERQIRDSLAKLRPVRPVPGINFIERVKRRALCFRHPNQLQASVGNGPSLVGKTNQRQRHPRRPDLGVIGLRCFKRGQRKNNVANSPRPDQKASQFLMLNQPAKSGDCLLSKNSLHRRRWTELAPVFALNVAVAHAPGVPRRHSCFGCATAHR